MRLAAVAILAVVSVVMVIAGMRQGAGSGGAVPVMPAPTPAPAGSVALPQQGGAVQDLMALADEGVVTGVDPATGRLRYRLTYESLDPLERGVFRMTRPRAWIFQRERLFEISAERGRLLWPARDREPESGHLEGAVTVVVRPRAPGDEDRSGPESPASDAPAEATLRTDALSFDTTFGEARTDGLVTIIGPGLDIGGDGLTVRISEDRARPVSLLRVERGGRFAYDPALASPGAARATDPAGSRRPGATTDEPVSSYYRASATGGVVARIGSRVLEGEEVLAWARLLDGRLTSGALEEARAPDAASSSSPDSGPRPGEKIEAVWSGALELRAVLDRPTELAHDDLFLRAQSPSGQSVLVRDDSEGSGGGSVRAVTMEYAGSRRAIALYGVGPIGVTITAPELLELIAGRAEVDLTSGLGAIPGPGLARAIGRTDRPGQTRDSAREIRWSDRADFRVALPTSGAGPARAEEVSFTGRVEARDGDATLAGEFVRLVLDRPRTAPPGSEAIALRRLVVEGDARAADESGGRIEAEALDVLFTEREGSETPIPVIATARGEVRASREGDSIGAGLLEARLAQNEDGRIVIETIEARLGVDVRSERETGAGRELIEARADRLNASDRATVVELLGEPATINRTARGESASVSGNSMRLASTPEDRGLSVFGPGSATYSSRRATPDGSGAYDRVQVDWGSGMVFDDRAGRAEAIGEVLASADLGDLERHVVRADRLTVTLTEPSPETGRALSHALAESDGSTPVKVELRRYAPPAEADPRALPVLEGLAYLEGPSVEIDAPARRLTVTGAGLLLLEDRRPQDPSGGARQEGGPLIAGGSRGTTLMTWTGALSFDQPAGRGVLTQGVAVKHRHPGDERLVEVRCERLTARFEAGDPEAPEGALALTGVDAEGGVLAVHGDRQLVCDRLTYDRARGVVLAFASPGNRVTVVDEAKGQHFVAESVELDLIGDALRAVGGSTLTPVP